MLYIPLQGIRMGELLMKAGVRMLFLALLASQQHELDVSPGFSADMISIQADILFLIRMWEDRMPWMYNYQHGVEDGIEAIIHKLREESIIKQ
jgi:hypothetical protein